MRCVKLWSRAAKTKNKYGLGPFYISFNSLQDFGTKKFSTCYNLKQLQTTINRVNQIMGFFSESVDLIVGKLASNHAIFLLHSTRL